MIKKWLLSAVFLSLASAAQAQSETETITGTEGSEIKLTELAQFDGAWAMTFLPDGRILVTEQSGTLWLVGRNGKKLGKIGNLPKVTERGQGGLGDIILAPDFAKSSQVFISYVERDEKNNKLSGRMVISPENADDGGGYLYISSGDRQKFTPAQNMDMNLGKVVRLNMDGSVPDDNPFSGQGGVTDEIWTLGHRNPLGIDFDAKGRLWAHEMGPRDGDELNHIVRSSNYGYPVVSNGKHYSGVEIPDHDTNPVFKAPAEFWVPAISPAGFTIYDSERFEAWRGNGFIGGLSSRALVRIEFEEGNRGPKAKEAERYEWGNRIREVETGPDGALYILEDNDGRLLRITPK